MEEDFSIYTIIYTIIYYGVIATGGIIIAGKMWLLFYLIGKKAILPYPHYTKKSLGIAGLCSSVYLILAVISVDSWELRTGLFPTIIAIPHAVYIAFFRKNLK